MLFSCATPLNRLAAYRSLFLADATFCFSVFFFSDVEGCIATAGQGGEGGNSSRGGARLLAAGQRKRGKVVRTCVRAARLLARLQLFLARCR